MSELAPEMRVGDRERRDVDAQLQEALADGVLMLTEYDERAALCWAARTRSELDAVVRDLPGAAARLPGLAPGQAPPTRRVIGVLSESDLEVPLRPGQPVQAVAVMGTAKVDLRREDLPPEVHVTAVAVMGEVKVHVPPGTTVHLTGGALMGERKIRTGPAAARGTVVHVNAVAVMGTVQVDDKVRKGGLLPAAAHWAPARRDRPHRAGRLGRRLAVGAVATLAILTGLQVATDQVAVFSNSEQAVRPADGVYDAGVLFGSVTVIVPDGTRAELGGTMLFGSAECRTACQGTSDSIVTIRGNGAFGSIEVVTESEHERRNGDS